MVELVDKVGSSCTPEGISEQLSSEKARIPELILTHHLSSKAGQLRAQETVNTTQHSPIGSTMNVGLSVNSTTSPPANDSSPMNRKSGYLAEISSLMNFSTA